jgi:hypothetical protein
MYNVTYQGHNFTSLSELKQDTREGRFTLGNILSLLSIMHKGKEAIKEKIH